MSSQSKTIEELRVLRESVMGEAEKTYQDLRSCAYQDQTIAEATKLNALAAYATMLAGEIIEAEYVADGGRRPL